MDLNSEVGKVFLKYSSKGELVPDDFTIRLWREYIDKLIHTGALMGKGRSDVETGQR